LLQVQFHVHIAHAIGALEGVLQLLSQLHPVLPEMCILHLDCFFNRFRAVGRESGYNIFGCRVRPGVRSQAFVILDEFDDLCSSNDWGTNGTQEWHLLLFLCDGEG
jgi:hypothetical protein